VDVRFIDGKASVTPQASSPSRDLVAEMMVIIHSTLHYFNIIDILTVKLKAK
jgi:hypothetical protein